MCRSGGAGGGAGGGRGGAPDAHSPWQGSTGSLPDRPAALPTALVAVALAVALFAVALPGTAPGDVASGAPPASAAAAAAAGGWQAIGPAEAGAATALAIDPREPDHLYLGTGDGVFLSRDGGASWRLCPLPGVTHLALHPGEGRRLYAVTRLSPGRARLWRSDDRGRTWTPLAAVEAPAGPLPSLTVHALAPDPRRPEVLWLAGVAVRGEEGSPAEARLWRSTDGGATLVPVPAPDAGPVRALLVDRKGRVYAGTARGVFLRQEDGAGWEPARRGLEGPRPGSFLEVRRLVAGSTQPRRLYAGTAAGERGALFRQTGEADRWNAIAADLPESGVVDLVVDPGERTRLWVLLEDGSLHHRRGEEWHPLGGLPAGATPRLLAVAAGSPATLHAVTAGGGVYRRVHHLPECVDDAHTLCLESRFRVEVRGGPEGAEQGRAVPLGGQGGWFWLDQPDLPAAAVKLNRGGEDRGVDGAPATVHVASLSDRALEVRVTDVTTGRTEAFAQAPGEHGEATGSATFPPGHRQGAEPLWFSALPDGGCGGESIDLCLWGGRFRVQVDWSTGDGEEGAAVADRLSHRAGWFRFRHPDDPELFLTLTDGRADNGHWWVTFASLSDAGFEVTVHDEDSGESVSYTVPPGAPHGHRDRRAFADR